MKINFYLDWAYWLIGLRFFTQPDIGGPIFHLIFYIGPAVIVLTRQAKL